MASQDTKLEHGAMVVIKEAVRDAMAEGAQVGVETHEKHHRWLEVQIKRTEQCMENRQRLMVHVLSWLAVSAVSGISYLLWLGYQAAVSVGY